MKDSKKFLRQCACCKEYKDKSELIRLTRDFKTNEIKINQNNSVNGRSVYICKNITCLENTLKKKKIENTLKSNIPESVKEELYAVLKK